MTTKAEIVETLGTMTILELADLVAAAKSAMDNLASDSETEAEEA